MKKYIATMVLSLVAIAIVSFGQTIVVRDNASTTAPVDQTRNFGVPVLPKTSSVVLSLNSATTTENITRSWEDLPANVVRFAEVATTAALLAPTVPGVLTIQYNSDNKKIYFRILDAAGADWGCVATLSADMSAALN